VETQKAPARPSAIPALEADVPPEDAGYLRDYLDALPIAAAVIGLCEGDPIVIASNARYEMVSGSMLAFDNGEPAVPLLRRKGLDDAVRDFFGSTAGAREFDWEEGGAISGRHFVVRIAHLPNDSHGECCLLSLLDRTAEIETQRSLRAEMLRDSLTGLPNRAAFNEAVDDAMISTDATGTFAVLVVDLNRFSRINDSMGSLAGDELIITVARRLVSVVRIGDMLARTGGDEFAILLKLCDGPGDALHAARRIEATLSTPFRLSDLEIRVDCGIGCALLSEEVATSEDLVRNAQFALKRAKQSGRVEIYRAEEASLARRRFSIETELRRAIDGDRLTLAFQPLIHLPTGKPVGFEALARWRHEDGEMIPPTEFIPVAEESGLILPLGRWALDAALRTLAEWDARIGRRLPIRMGVNVSPIQIARDDVARMVVETLAVHGLGGDRLTIEVTESAIIADPERARRVLGALKGVDAKIAMDDFGTGYSSLAYLQKLPIDVLKIDRSFISAMLRDRDSLAIVRAVLSLAESLGMKTTAEGIETAELAETLTALGCSDGQGFYFAEPLSADAALAYWAARSA
jgi:diguanylate cyclase (GGDEF)-like protein